MKKRILLSLAFVCLALSPTRAKGGCVLSVEGNGLSETFDVSPFTEALKVPDSSDAIVGTDEVPLTVDNVLNAHGQGFYIYYTHRLNNEPNPNARHQWESPEERGVLFFDEMEKRLTESDSLRTALRKASRTYRVTWNQAFERVIEGCRQMKRFKEIEETVEGKKVKRTVSVETSWITPEILSTYIRLHRMGSAHSVEIWRTQDDGKEVLVGGAYGLQGRGVHSVESMFHLRERDGENAGTLAAVTYLRALKQAGFSWIDTQQVTTQTGRLGGKLIPRAEYFALAATAAAEGSETFAPLPEVETLEAFLKRIVRDREARVREEQRQAQQTPEALARKAARELRKREWQQRQGKLDQLDPQAP